MLSVTIAFRGPLAALCRQGGADLCLLTLTEPTTVKDAVESLGVPHTEIDLLLVDRRPVTFAYRLADRDRVEVHPVPEPPAELPPPADPWEGHRLQARPLQRNRFACDRHLGRLARLLRLGGFDTFWHDAVEPEEILEAVAAEERAVLTGARGLLMRRDVACGMLVAPGSVDDQLTAVLRRFHLGDDLVPFGRCSLCNGTLTLVPKPEVADSVPPRSYAWRETFHRCTGCGQVYWEGTHAARIRERLERAAARVPGREG